MPGYTIPNIADAEDQTQAQVDARDFSDMLAPAFSYTGVLSGCAVTAQGTPNMTVAVAAGVVVIGGTVATVSAGNVTITANATGNARFDLICVDATGVKSAVAGTASATPVFPDPAGKVVLAAVRVPAGAASISTAKIVDKRIFNTLTSLAFGSTGDTNLYRLFGTNLATDSNFRVGRHLTVDQSDFGSKLFFGSAQDDASMSRGGPDSITVSGALRAFKDFRANQGTANVVWVGFDGASSFAPVIVFGDAVDTNLHRAGAARLGTIANYFQFPVRTSKSYRPVFAHDVANGIFDLDYNGQEPGATDAEQGFILRLRFGQGFQVFVKPGDGTGIASHEVFKVDPYGLTTTGYGLWNVAAGALAFQAFDGATQQFRVQGKTLSVGNISSGISVGLGNLYVGGSGDKPTIVAQGAASADIQQWQDSANAVLTRIDSAGALKFGSAGDTNLYRSAASVIKTDGMLLVGNLGVPITASAVGGAQTNKFPVYNQSTGALVGYVPIYAT